MLEASRHKQIKQRRKLLAIVLTIFTVVLVLCTAAVVLRLLGFYNRIHSEAQTTPKQQQEEKTQYNFLLLGYGGGTHEGTYLTDTIIVTHIDVQKKTALLISIPRDIWVTVPTTGEVFHNKINAVYQIGLFPKQYPAVDTSFITEDNPSGLLKEVIRNVTGLQIDAFAAVDFQGFIKTIDTLDGIDITVARTFDDYEYPIEGKENDLCGRDEEFAQISPILDKITTAEDQKKLYEEKPELEQFVKDIKDHPAIAFPCRYETLHFDAGAVHMDGATALKYARSRHSLEDGGDFNRAVRQQNVIDAVKKKVLSIGFIPKIIPLLDELEEHIKTDLSLADMNKLLIEGRNADQYTVTTLVLSDNFLRDGFSEYGGYILSPKAGIDNWQPVRQTVYNIVMGITPTATPAPTVPTVRPTRP